MMTTGNKKKKKFASASSLPHTIKLIAWRKDEGPESLFRAAELARIENQKREQEHNRVGHGKQSSNQENVVQRNYVKKI